MMDQNTNLVNVESVVQKTGVGQTFFADSKGDFNFVDSNLRLFTRKFVW